jgi:hypothetical protein
LYAEDPVTDQASRGRSRLLARTTVALVGILLLIVGVRQAGWDNIAASFGSLGPWFLAIVALGAVRMAFRARAWSICSRAGDHAGIPFTDAFAAALAADAVGNLTPLGLLASEPTKVALSRRHVPMLTSVSSVAVENGFYIVSVVAMLLAGTWVLLRRADVPAMLARVGEGVVVASAVGAVGVLWMFRARPAVLSRLWSVLARVRRRPTASGETLSALENRVYDVAQWPMGRLVHVAAFEALFHVAAVAEVWLVLRALPGGAATTVVDAFLMEASGRFITVAFKFIPYRLGVDEIGSGSVSQLLGLGTAAGVTLALVRRIRILILNAVGVVILARGR